MKWSKDHSRVQILPGCRPCHNVATCAAAPCNQCGLSGHIGREYPDNAKAKKTKKGKGGNIDQAEMEEATGIA